MGRQHSARYRVSPAADSAFGGSTFFADTRALQVVPPLQISYADLGAGTVAGGVGGASIGSGAGTVVGQGIRSGLSLMLGGPESSADQLVNDMMWSAGFGLIPILVTLALVVLSLSTMVLFLRSCFDFLKLGFPRAIISCRR